jgi:hypothetical protein
MAKKDKLKVQILPLRGIGGYGEAGAVVEMPVAEAEYYVKEGYVRVVEEIDAPEPVHPKKAQGAEEK